MAGGRGETADYRDVAHSIDSGDRKRFSQETAPLLFSLIRLDGGIFAHPIDVKGV